MCYYYYPRERTARISIGIPYERTYYNRSNWTTKITCFIQRGRVFDVGK